LGTSSAQRYPLIGKAAAKLRASSAVSIALIGGDTVITHGAFDYFRDRRK